MTKRLGSSRRISSLRWAGRERGFTLVELLVVLGVFVALVSLTIPSYLATRPQRLLSAETNRLAAVIRQGRLFALRDNQNVYLEFLPEIDMYRMWNANGWRAYSDVIDFARPRNPDIGHYNGDFDGDGDFWWGDGGTPESPSGLPEDNDVQYDGINGVWYYEDTDGTYTDPDVLLMPQYPGNRPIRTVSPRLRVTLDAGDGSIINIIRDFSDTGGVAGDSVIPFEVDIRMRNLTDNWDPSMPLGKRNGVLSHFPLLYVVFFGDGTLAASWDVTADDPSGLDEEILDLEPGRLGAIQIHMQVRGEEYNPEAYNLFNPEAVAQGYTPVGRMPLSPFDTLSLEDSNSEALGRIITLNNLSGRVVIRDFKPSDLDRLHESGVYYM